MAWIDISASGLLKDGGVYQIGIVTSPTWTVDIVKTKFESAPPGLPGGAFSIDSVTPGSSSGTVKSWKFLGTWHGAPVVVSRKPADTPDVQYAAVFEQVPDPPPPPPKPNAESDTSLPVAGGSSKSWPVVLGLLALGGLLGGGTYFFLKQKAYATSNPKRDYPYISSPSGRYILSRDGKIVTRGTEQEIWKYLHTTHGYSVEHAIKYEGYKIQPDLTLPPKRNPVEPFEYERYQHGGVDVEISLSRLDPCTKYPEMRKALGDLACPGDLYYGRAISPTGHELVVTARTSTGARRMIEAEVDRRWLGSRHLANPVRYETTFDHHGVPVHVHREDIDGRATYCADYRAVEMTLPGSGGVVCGPDKSEAMNEAKRRIDALGWRSRTMASRAPRFRTRSRSGY